MMSIQTTKKPRILCLHGGYSNAGKFEEEVSVWPDYVLEKMDLVFINGAFPMNDKTPVSEFFTWYHDEDDFDEGIAYIEDRMVELGPFDGVLGFSQGAIIAGALPGMQQQHSALNGSIKGVCLTEVGKIEHVILISGAKLGGAFPAPKLAENAFAYPIDIPSLHIFGESDMARPNAPELVEAYVDPLVIFHHGGHEVPKLDEKGLKIMFAFLNKINAIEEVVV